jgi:hypothetical protein
VDLRGEMDGKNVLYDKVVTMAGVLPGNINRSNLLYGGMRRARERRIFTGAALITVALAAAVIAAPPAGGYYFNQKAAESLAIIDRPEYAGARERIAERALLDDRLRLCAADREYIQDSNVDYPAILYRLGRGLLSDVNVYGVKCERDGQGLEICFTARDLSNFYAERSKLNESGQFSVSEPVIMGTVEKDARDCLVTVSWISSGADGQANGGNADGRIDGQNNSQIDGQTNGQADDGQPFGAEEAGERVSDSSGADGRDGQIDGQTDGQADGRPGDASSAKEAEG